MNWVETIVAVSVALAAYFYLTAGRSRRRRGTLASYRPTPEERPERELGMEALDLDAAATVHRRNESLENSNWGFIKGRGFLWGAKHTHIAPMADDETYAQRYHSAFQRKTGPDRSK